MSNQNQGEFQHRPGYGSLFKNHKKETDAQPDYKGECADPDGNPLEIAAWIKTDKKGRKYMSFKLSPPRGDGQTVAEMMGKAKAAATATASTGDEPF